MTGCAKGEAASIRTIHAQQGVTECAHSPTDSPNAHTVTSDSLRGSTGRVSPNAHTVQRTRRVALPRGWRLEARPLRAPTEFTYLMRRLRRCCVDSRCGSAWDSLQAQTSAGGGRQRGAEKSTPADEAAHAQRVADCTDGKQSARGVAHACVGELHRRVTAVRLRSIALAARPFCRSGA